MILPSVPPGIRAVVRNPCRLMANKIQASSDTLKVIPHNQYHTEGSLSPSNVAPDPLEQFRVWFTEAVAKVSEPEVMTLSTATASGIPSARTVLFKQVDSTGFVFFTNYTSRKSKELLENPNAALVFYWRELHKQVRVLGRVKKLNEEENEEYFRTRPVGSQLGAWASKQSTVIEEGEIEQRLEKYKQRFHANEGDPSSVQVPVPDFWGGWRVVPQWVDVRILPSALQTHRDAAAKSSSGWESHLECTTASSTSDPMTVSQAGQSIVSRRESSDPQPVSIPTRDNLIDIDTVCLENGDVSCGHVGYLYQQ